MRSFLSKLNHTIVHNRLVHSLPFEVAARSIPENDRLVARHGNQPVLVDRAPAHVEDGVVVR